MDLVLTRRDPWFGGEKKLKSGEAIPTELEALQESQKIMSILIRLFPASGGDEQPGDTEELCALRKRRLSREMPPLRSVWTQDL